ncbi:hypothetical protein HLB25_20845 [Dickeya dadantii]|uniref:hypothetical protein n=1 Tax=Dickeya dadantii TaxID=204038 RepID=UPI001495D218|nr:hypothetical protein [Dickeya dadantii]NPE57398.1 hypothetical protein [Dickeya dadantii]NPE68971.1 hypothetical protein [Dickeya dadantii]
MTRKGVLLKDLEELVSRENIISVVAVEISDNEWTFYMDYKNQEGEKETVFIEKQRNGIRTWSDPRLMFNFMREKFNITEGTFRIKPML